MWDSVRLGAARMQVVLEWDEETMPTWPGCELPALESSRAGGTRRAFALDGVVGFGDVLVATGTGRVAPDPAAAAAAAAGVNCRIRVCTRGVALGGPEGGVDVAQWQTIWEKEFFFSDDAQRVARVAELSQAQQRHALEAKVCMLRAAALRPPATLASRRGHASALCVRRADGGVVPQPAFASIQCDMQGDAQ